MMSYQKNDRITLRITDISTDGQGIGKTEDVTFFVKDTVIGDEITASVMKMKKNYGYARLQDILKPSPYRVKEQCPCAVQCGGCQLQAMSYEKQLSFKMDKVLNNLKRIGGFTDIPAEPIIRMEDPFHYRNKAQYPVGRNREGRLTAGFYAGRTHSIIDHHDCILGKPENRQIIEIVLAYMEKHHIDPYDEISGEGLVRHILTRYGFSTGQWMVCLILNGRKLPAEQELIQSLLSIEGMTSICVNVNQARTNVIMGDKTYTLHGKSYIEDRIGNLLYQISPRAFFFFFSVQTEKLYNKALEYAGLTGTETVWDLYCGTGTISLFLAQKARSVRGVEIIPEAVENAVRNAKLNHITNAEFFVGKAEEILPLHYKNTGERADVIVVDPPRKGCDASLLDTMAAMQPERIVYVSCDSATLARDLKILCGKGYRLEKICPTDQFPMTVHVEACCLLTRYSGAG